MISRRIAAAQKMTPPEGDRAGFCCFSELLSYHRLFAGYAVLGEFFEEVFFKGIGFDMPGKRYIAYAVEADRRYVKRRVHRIAADDFVVGNAVSREVVFDKSQVAERRIAHSLSQQGIAQIDEEIADKSREKSESAVHKIFAVVEEGEVGKRFLRSIGICRRIHFLLPYSSLMRRNVRQSAAARYSCTVAPKALEAFLSSATSKE